MPFKLNFKFHPLSDSHRTNVSGRVASFPTLVAHVDSDFAPVHRKHQVRAFVRAGVGLPENDELILVTFGKLDTELPLNVLVVRRACISAFRPQLCPLFFAALVGDFQRAATL